MIKQFLLSLLLINTLYSIEAQENFGLKLDGSTGEIRLCDSDNFDIGDGFTVEAWIFASAWKAEAWQGSIINKDQQGPDSGFAFRAGKNGILSMVMSVNRSWFEVQTDPIMNANQWYHVAAVVNGTTLSLFINGELVESGTFSGTPTANNQPLTIGASPGFGGRIWNGVIDEVRVWNIARTPEEISDNTTAVFTGTEEGLVAYLPMNEGSAQSTANLADNSCAGTLDAAAWEDGFSIPKIDAGVLSVNAPDVLTIFERPVKVSVTVQNYGSEAISEIPIDLDINGLPTLSETFNITLQPGETANLTFTEPLDLTQNNTNLLNAKTALEADKNTLNNATSYRYRRPKDGNLLRVLNEEQHNFGGEGQTKFTPVNMPENMEAYEKLLLHISVECPRTGCDPWDQPASFFVVTEKGEFEIARYITPFGIECGDWVVDVTDFKSILSGQIIFKSFVQVWGSSGWLVNADLEFIKGEEKTFQKLTPLWETQNWVYGDPAISYDLPAQTNTIAENTQNSHMRMTLSGHGQGNTDNAAEFANKTHDIFVNGAIAGIHNPWKTDCAQNACSDQAGTWLFSRAGWCPGQQVNPFIFDLNEDIVAGEDLTLDYVLEDYTNFINTGYNGSSHTEPHFRIFSYLVEQSDSRYEAFNNLSAENLELTTNGDANNPVFESLVFEIKNSGTEAISNVKVAYYVNGIFVLEEIINEEIVAGSTYQHTFSQVMGFEAKDDNTVFAVVTAEGDENTNDDVSKLFINDQLVNAETILADEIALFPNPTSGAFQLELEATMMNGQIEIVDAQGKVIQQLIINDLLPQIRIESKGLYLIRIRTTEGKELLSRVLVQ
ncbi:MAG: LamG-like jellyroll fold domain-containing protein [Bacteroidota bacterium]